MKVDKYYSRTANDKWVEYIFQGMENGFYVEAGATNGIRNSSTYILEKYYNWTGICVEPSPNQYGALKKNRECLYDNRCLSDKSGTQVNYIHFTQGLGHSGIEETFDEKHKDMIHSRKNFPLQKETISLQDLLIEHESPEVIDYIGLDVEGHEPKILSTFPFFKPYMVLTFSIEGHECDELLNENGYVSVKNPYTNKKYESYFIHRDAEKYKNIGIIS